MNYIPDFAIRGLHYDIRKGVLLKLDSFLQIQFGSVYRGLTPLTDDEVLKLYKNRIMPIAYVEGESKDGKVPCDKCENLFISLFLLQANSTMIQLADLFSVPEMGLLCNVTDYFEKNHFDYHPEILFRDVRVRLLEFI